MTAINKPNWPLVVGAVVVVFIVCSIIAVLPAFHSNQFILTGITIDLTITAPFVYFLFIRKTTVAKTTVVRVFVIGVLLAGFLLHDKNVFYLNTIKKWLIPAIEIYTIFAIAYKFYLAKKAGKIKYRSADFIQHCRSTLLEVIGSERIAAVLTSEFAVIYYFFKLNKKPAIQDNTIFTYHRKTNTRLLIATFLILILIETIVFHFLLMLWNNTTAWVFTGLSVYTCMQLVAHIKAMKHRPILVFIHFICLRNGLAGEVDIEVDNIIDICLNNKNTAGDNIVKLSLLKGLEKSNITIQLKQPVDIVCLFGIKKRASIVQLHVDEPNRFVSAIINKKW